MEPWERSLRTRAPGGRRDPGCVALAFHRNKYKNDCPRRGVTERPRGGVAAIGQRADDLRFEPDPIRLSSAPIHPVSAPGPPRDAAVGGASAVSARGGRPRDGRTRNEIFAAGSRARSTPKSDPRGRSAPLSRQGRPGAPHQATALLPGPNRRRKGAEWRKKRSADRPGRDPRISGPVRANGGH
jgi:hypothetical protein